jgi:hypothetical protein
MDKPNNVQAAKCIVVPMSAATGGSAASLSQMVALG